MFERRRLTKFQRELLGKFPDAELARRFQVSIKLVVRERHHQGLSPARPWSRITWTQDMLDRLGRQSDAHLAAAWGVGVPAVGGKRRSLGIPACPAPVQGHSIAWTSAMIADLQRLPMARFAVQYGISEGIVQGQSTSGPQQAHRTWHPSQHPACSVDRRDACRVADHERFGRSPSPAGDGPPGC